jgi:PAS domain S-box-containing protein
MNDSDVERDLVEIDRGVLLDTMLQGVVHQDADGTIVWMNPAAERILGKTRQEFLGETSVSVEHHTIREDGSPFPGREHPAMVALRTGQKIHGVTMGVYNPRESAYRWIDVSAVPVRQPGGSGPDRVYTLFDDITDRKRAEEALQAGSAILKGVLDASVSGIMAFESIRNPGGRITDFEWRLCNATAERMVGRRATDLIGRRLLVEMPGNGEDGLFDLYVAVVETGRPLHHEHYYEHEGLRHWFETCAVKLGDGFAVTFSDITERKRAEAALRQSEERLRVIVENTPDHLLVQDLELRYEFVVNPQLGMTEEGMRGKTDAELLSSADAEHITKLKRHVLATGQTMSASVALENRQGQKEYFEGAYVPRRDAMGHVTGLIGYFRNVSDRQRAEEALRQSDRLYRAIGESIDYGIWVCAPDGRNTYASQSFLDLVGLTQEQCSNFGWGDVLHPDDAERTIAAWQECVGTGGTWDIEHRFLGADGQWHPILARGVPVRNERGEIVCWAGINLDISQLKRTEADLREREAALEEADRHKNHFLAMLSHELRNPLAPIANSLFVLDHAAPGGEQARRAKAVITRQVDQLTRLVDDLLDVTRVTRGKLRLQRARFDLVQTVLRSAEDHRGAFVEAGIAFEIRVGDRPIWVDGDEARMAQVVGNLLTNASKFTGRDGQVVLTLAEDATARTGVVRVKDSGVGVAPNMLRRLFEPFMQADDSIDRSRGGLGLGLALVKGIVELHGGQVEVHSEGPGTGAEFVVRLPAELGEPARERMGRQSSRPPPRRVLVIEDNVDAADSLRDALGFGEHQVEVAYSGAEGLKKAREFKPEVVLCDIGLPGMTGYEVARAFRGDEALRTARLVALTGYALSDDERRAREAGFDQHLPKPPSLEKIEELLSSLPSPDAQ